MPPRIARSLWYRGRYRAIARFDLRNGSPFRLGEQILRDDLGRTVSFIAKVTPLMENFGFQDWLDTWPTAGRPTRHGAALVVPL